MADVGVTPPTECSDQRVVVIIDNTPVPTLEVETFHNKDGVADRNTYSRAIIPTSWKNEDIIGQIQAFGDEEGYFSKADVYWQDASTGTWTQVQSGYVRAIGGGSKTGTAKVIIGGWSQFFTAIPFSGTYDEPTVATVFGDVIEKFNEAAPISLESTGIGSEQQESVSPSNVVETLTGSGPNTISNKVTVALWEGIDNIANVDTGYDELDDSSLPASKNFTSNRHTLKDVMEWMCGETNARWYVDVQDETPVLVFDTNLENRHFYDASIGSPGCRVINNDAIQEIVPVNSITVNGESSTSIFGFRIKELDSNTYPTATVQYDPLVNAASGQLLTPIVESETLSIDATEKKAKRKLREKIAGASGGDVKMFGKPDIEPFDHFTGVPTCGGQHVGDMSPIEYEVTNVQHKKVGGKEFATRIGVHVWVDTSKISTTNASMEEL